VVRIVTTDLLMVNNVLENLTAVIMKCRPAAYGDSKSGSPARRRNSPELRRMLAKGATGRNTVGMVHTSVLVPGLFPASMVGNLRHSEAEHPGSGPDMVYLSNTSRNITAASLQLLGAM
jgi:hypothetical protein